MIDSKKKIDIIMSNVSGRGGMETVLEEVLDSEVLKHDFSFSVILKDQVQYSDFLTLIRKKTSLFYFGTKTRFVAKLSLFKYLLFTDSDMLIITGPTSIYLAYLVRFFFKKKYVILSWMHFSIEDIQIDRDKLRYADYHLAIASGIRKQLLELGVDSSRIFLIYNPIKRQNDVIKKSQGETTHLIYIGRVMLRGQKNMKFLIDALNLAQRHKKFSLDVYGSGPTEQEVKDYAASNILDDSITWHGWIEQPWDMVSEADALVITSKYEGFGMVLAESISRGLIAIAPNILGPDDIIVNNSNGLLYTPNDPEDLAKKMLSAREFSRGTNPVTVKNTLSKLYATAYFHNLDEVLLKIIQ